MKKIINEFLEEAISLIPVTLFFFIIFSFVALTDDFMRIQQNVGGYVRFTMILVASLIMGKVVFIADHLKWIHLFSSKPLIYVTMWKSIFYVIMSIIVRLLEHLVQALFGKKPFLETCMTFLSDVDWMRFWVVQLWLILLFVIFVAGRELTRVIGVQKVREIFLGNN